MRLSTTLVRERLATSPAELSQCFEARFFFSVLDLEQELVRQDRDVRVCRRREMSTISAEATAID